MAVRYAFDPDSMSDPERAILEESVLKWLKKIDLLDEEKQKLRVIVITLEAAEKKRFNCAREQIERDRRDGIIRSSDN